MPPESPVEDSISEDEEFQQLLVKEPPPWPPAENLYLEEVLLLPLKVYLFFRLQNILYIKSMLHRTWIWEAKFLLSVADVV